MLQRGTAATSPLVTIITPTYNRAAFLPKAIESVLEQTHRSFEFLIVDDGSTDNSAEILDHYATRDSRVRIFRQENQGQSVARNKAIAKAKGDYICFLDSDNYWPESKLEQQLSVFDRNLDIDIVYGDIVTIDEHGHEVSRNNMSRYSGNIARWMLRDNCVSMNTAMAKRHCFEELGAMSGQRRVADDYDLWLRFSARFTFLYEPEYWAYYRVMDDQISTDKTARFDSNEAIINDFRSRFPDALSAREFDAGFAVFHVRKARYLASVGRKRNALAELRKAFGYCPFGYAVWRGAAAVLLK